MAEWNNDDELFRIGREELYTAVVGDICDQLGMRRRFLPPELRPLKPAPGVPVMLGRAMTVLEADVFSSPPVDRRSARC